MEERQPNAIIVVRISSEKQVLDSNTLQNQIEDCMKLITDNKWYLCHEPFEIVESGGEEDGQQEINKILDFCSHKSNKVEYLVIRDIGRFTRQGFGGWTNFKKSLRDCNVKIKDSKNVIQDEINLMVKKYGPNFDYEFARYNPSESAEIEESQRAKAFYRDNMLKMLDASITYAREGYWTHASIYGLKNEKIETKRGRKTILSPNPNTAGCIKKAFEMRIKGFNDFDIAKELNRLGYTTSSRKKRDKRTMIAIREIGLKPITSKQIQRWVQRPIYAGIIYEKWTDWQPIKAMFDGLVSINDFNLANKDKRRIVQISKDKFEILTNGQKGFCKEHRSKMNPKYLYRGLIMCPICKKNGKLRPLTASSSKGKSGKYFPSYHCNGRNGIKHKRFSVPVKILDKKFNDFIDNLRFSDEQVTLFEEVLINSFNRKNIEALDDSIRAGKHLGDLKEQQKAITTAIIANSGQPQILEQLQIKFNEVQSQIEEYEDVQGECIKAEKDVREYLKWGRILLEHPAEILIDRENVPKTHQLLKAIFKELPTYEELIVGTPKLKPLFKQKEAFKKDKRQLAEGMGVEPTCHF